MGLAPGRILSSVSALLGGPFQEREIRSATGLSRGQWKDLARFFPRLGADPGPAAARARRRYGRLVGRALASERDAPAFRDAPPTPEPCLYATAHIGDLRSLRYLLRPLLAIATVIDTDERSRAAGGRERPEIEERVPRDFPHVLSSREPHRLRSALERGSLIVSTDLPGEDGAEFPCLGGRIRLDPRPFRLARLARVPCRPLFLTSPGGRLTVTVGPELPAEEASALGRFAQIFAAIADETPYEIDGFTWWSRLGITA